VAANSAASLVIGRLFRPQDDHAHHDLFACRWIQPCHRAPRVACHPLPRRVCSPPIRGTQENYFIFASAGQKNKRKNSTHEWLVRAARRACSFQPNTGPGRLGQELNPLTQNRQAGGIARDPYKTAEGGGGDERKRERDHYKSPYCRESGGGGGGERETVTRVHVAKCVCEGGRESERARARERESERLLQASMLLRERARGRKRKRERGRETDRYKSPCCRVCVCQGGRERERARERERGRERDRYKSPCCRGRPWRHPRNKRAREKPRVHSQKSEP
jgi:hypothetical protein